MKCLVTGGAGFIGVSLALRLHKHNKIIILDNFRRDALSKETELKNSNNITVIKGDVLNKEDVRLGVEKADIVIHLASIAGVDSVMKNPVPTMEVSLLGTHNVLKACYEKGNIERFIDFSTSEVFGRYAYKVDEGEVTTLGAVGEARWTYAVSKLATEHLSHNYFRQYKLPTVAVRPFNIFGPRQVGEGAIHHFIVRALEGKDIVIHNDGSQIRSWCFISDIVDGIELAMTSQKAIGETFNIGNPRSTLTIYNLAGIIKDLVGSTSNIVFKKWPFPDVELRIPSIDKARKYLGFEPKVELQEGLIKTIEWYKKR